MADHSRSNGHKPADERFEQFARENADWNRKMGDALRELDEALQEGDDAPAPARDAEPA